MTEAPASAPTEIPSVSLRIYPSFSEVRLRVDTTEPHLTVTFPAEAWRSIDASSLTLLGLPFTSVTVTQQASWLSSLEGQVVGLRTPQGRQDITLVRAADLVVRDADGAYFRVEERQLLLPQLPPAQGGGGRVMDIALSGAGQGALSYQTQGVTWQAHYALDIAGSGEATLTAYAEIGNQTDQTFAPEQVVLLAGEVQQRSRRYGQSEYNFERESIVFAAAQVAAPRLAEAEEVAGLYRFELTQPPALPGNSTVRVPFQPVTLQSYETRATLDTRFDARAQPTGVLRRHYCLRAVQPLLGARVMVREQDFVVGQTQWTETAAGQEVNFELGRDPDVTYARTVELLGVQVQPELSVSDDGDTVKLTHYTYQVTYALRNAKTRAVDFRINEGASYDLTAASCDGDATIEGGQLRFVGRLGAGEERTLRSQVVMEKSEVQDDD